MGLPPFRRLLIGRIEVWFLLMVPNFGSWTFHYVRLFGYLLQLAELGLKRSRVYLRLPTDLPVLREMQGQLFPLEDSLIWKA